MGQLHVVVFQDKGPCSANYYRQIINLVFSWVGMKCQSKMRRDGTMLNIKKCRLQIIGKFSMSKIYTYTLIHVHACPLIFLL